MAAMLCPAAETVLFDTDSGFFGDDGAALVMLLRRPDKVRIQAITVVSGNLWAKQGSEYMFHILRLLQRNVPLYIGEEKPLVHTVEMSRREGKIEFAGALAVSPDEFLVPFGGKSTGRRPRPRGVEYLIDAVDRAPGSITILALGPMTNLAVALQRRPDLAGKIRRLVFMGGNVHVPGNASAAAEFNFWFDPEAAQIVLRSHIQEKVMFGLDICNQAELTRSHFDELVAVKTPITALIREDMGNRYPGFLKNRQAKLPMWDSLAAAWLIDPAIVTGSRTMHLDVVTAFGSRYGAVVPAQARTAPPVKVMLGLDFPRAYALFRELLTRQR
jgi:inosine-uridine nucleoside N-ribohydrolase